MLCWTFLETGDSIQELFFFCFLFFYWHLFGGNHLTGAYVCFTGRGEHLLSGFFLAVLEPGI